MLKHCVLTVDYSGEWGHTLDYLPSLLALLQCEQLTLVHVVEVFKRKFLQDQPNIVEENLKAIAGRIRDDLQVAVDWEVRSGLPPPRLLMWQRRERRMGLLPLIVATPRSGSSSWATSCSIWPDSAMSRW